ncbi:hypothetical protein [Nocardia sp. NPDC003183]
MSDPKPEGVPDPLAGFDIEIHPVSLDGLNDSTDQRPKKADNTKEPSKSRSPSRRPSASRPARQQKNPPKVDDHPKGTSPTARPPKKPIQPRESGKRERGAAPKSPRGGGPGAKPPGVDRKQPAKSQIPASARPERPAAPPNRSKPVDLAKRPPAKAPLAGKPGGPKGSKPKGGKVDTKGLKDEATALKNLGGAFKDNLAAIKNHTGAGKKMVGKVGGVAKNLKKLTGAIRTASAVQKIIGGASKLWSVAQTALNLVWNASPVGWFTLALGAAILAITLIVEHWDEIKAAFSVVKEKVLDPVGRFFQDQFGEVLKPFTHIGTAVSGAFKALCSTVGGVFQKMVHYIAVVVGKVADLLGKFRAFPGVGGIADAMSEWAQARMADGGLVGASRAKAPAGSTDEIVVDAGSPKRAVMAAVDSDHLRVAGTDTGRSALSKSPHIAPLRGVRRTGATVRAIDHSTTIALNRGTDTSFARSRAVHAQRALTYAGGSR